MAFNDLFGEIDKTLGACPAFWIRNTVGAVASPVSIYAVGQIPVSLTIIDAMVKSLATNAGATARVDTNINGAGMVALTNAMVGTPVGTQSRTTSVVAAQSVVGPLDALQVTKNGAADTVLLFLLMYMT